MLLSDTGEESRRGGGEKEKTGAEGGREGLFRGADAPESVKGGAGRFPARPGGLAARNLLLLLGICFSPRRAGNGSGVGRCRGVRGSGGSEGRKEDEMRC